MKSRSDPVENRRQTDDPGLVIRTSPLRIIAKAIPGQAILRLRIALCPVIQLFIDKPYMIIGIRLRQVLPAILIPVSQAFFFGKIRQKCRRYPHQESCQHDKDQAEDPRGNMSFLLHVSIIE